jgi:hypothetical protein
MLVALACNKSSKSRAAIFFNSDTFRPNRRIVPHPKVGIWRYLESALSNLTSVICRSYRRSSSASLSPFTLSNILNRCMNTAFHTPSSNSCKRSTTSIKKKSNPVWQSRSENAFYARVSSGNKKNVHNMRTDLCRNQGLSL